MNKDLERYRNPVRRLEMCRAYGRGFYYRHKKKRNAATYEWQKKNPEKTRAARKRWRTKNLEYIHEKARRYRLTHREEMLAQEKEWRKKNREHVREYSRQYYRKHAKELLVSSFRKRDSIKARMLLMFGGKCGRCGFDDPRALQLDHINACRLKVKDRLRLGEGGTPLYRKILKGKRNRNEFQLLCANCNWIKRAEKNENRTKERSAQ